jgi:hypothetical protein
MFYLHLRPINNSEIAIPLYPLLLNLSKNYPRTYNLFWRLLPIKETAHTVCSLFLNTYVRDDAARTGVEGQKNENHHADI